MHHDTGPQATSSSNRPLTVCVRFGDAKAPTAGGPTTVKATLLGSNDTLHSQVRVGLGIAPRALDIHSLRNDNSHNWTLRPLSACPGQRATTCLCLHAPGKGAERRPGLHASSGAGGRLSRSSGLCLSPCPLPVQIQWPRQTHRPGQARGICASVMLKAESPWMVLPECPGSVVEWDAGWVGGRRPPLGSFQPCTWSVLSRCSLAGGAPLWVSPCLAHRRRTGVRWSGDKNLSAGSRVSSLASPEPSPLVHGGHAQAWPRIQA